ncbi:MAG: flagellar basal body-associated protein FliL [Leptothrix sp. (in: b-proteobacteria)]
MSAAAAAAPAGDAPAKKGSKKLIIIIAIVAVLLLAGGGAAFFLMKKHAAEAEAGDAEPAPAQRFQPPEHKKDAHAAPPVFVPLEPFVVNLADREHERYAQIGLTLEVDDEKVAEQIKLYLPAIRNGILMVAAHKTSEELLQRDGKERLLADVMRETVRPLGIELDDEEPAADTAADKKKKKRRAPVYNPVRQVLISSFIVQ